MNRGMQAPLDAEQGKRTDSPLEPPERMWPHQHFVFNPVKIILDF